MKKNAARSFDELSTPSNCAGASNAIIRSSNRRLASCVYVAPISPVREVQFPGGLWPTLRALRLEQADRRKNIRFSCQMNCRARPFAAALRDRRDERKESARKQSTAKGMGCAGTAASKMRCERAVDPKQALFAARQAERCEGRKRAFRN